MIRKEIKFYSLYEYLGKAAGFGLGEQVSRVAQRFYIPILHQYVSNPKFKGEVALYPEYFLKNYFETNRYETAKQAAKRKPELPF